MAAKKHIIIGSGAAGLSALEKIRSITSEGEIRIISREDSLPYSPTALPALLSGKVNEKQIISRGEDYFGRLKSTLVRGKEAVAVEPDKRRVTYQDGEAEKYDTLLIACGSQAVMPAIEGLDRVGFFSLHTLDDCRRLLHELEDKRSVAVLGGGLVGMEIATALIEKHYEVKIIEKEDRLLPLYFDHEAEAYLRAIFANRGAQIFSGQEVTAIRKSKRRVEIGLRSGDSLNVEVLIVAVGVKARTSLAETSGIKTNRGIVVDSRMRTNVSDVYAAGDVAEATDFFTRQPGMNPILPSAVTQGEVAGANMVGEDAEYEGWIPRNAFVFFGNRAFSVGLSMPPKNYEVMKERDDSTKQLKKLVYNGNRLVGGVFLNHDVDPGVVQYLIKKKLDIGPHKRLLFERPKEISQWLMSEAERRGSALSAARS